MPARTRKTPPTKRAPKQQRSIERIDAILAATEAVLTEDGYDGLTMVKIAAQAGITHTSIYHYFRSVEAILESLISRMMSDFDRGVADRVARAETPQALIEKFVISLESGFETYRSTPVARGLWTATRYLPTLRKLDDEDAARNSQLFIDRFLALAPDTDRDAVRVTTMLAATLAVPAYEAALALPKRLQKRAIADFLTMIRTQLSAAVGVGDS